MSGPLRPVDWAIVLAYVVFALWVGVRFARRAGKNVDEYFLSGRALPWWVAGTSMVATSFAADTPLAISGVVREFGIWKNWFWWCFAVNGVLQVFLFARWWRRGEVMTKAELVELRYAGAEAKVLRGSIGILHATVMNTVVMCWVLLAASKIAGVLFQVDKTTGLALGCAIALTYSLLAGFWGVVVTDLVQFLMAMAGAILLAALAWGAVGGADGVHAAVQGGAITPDALAFFPFPGEGGPLDGSFWTVSFVAACVYLGVQWWAAENVDGSSTSVQRVSASKDERHGLLATLWYIVAHYALRPWCWILVGLASLIVLPQIEVTSPVAGTVLAAGPDEVVVAPEDGGAPVAVPLAVPEAEADWFPEPRVGERDTVSAGAVVARTDNERAYVVMMIRYLPIGLLGLVAASLLAAFMSTIDTHVNLASSFFVNDVYRRFCVRDRAPRHYVGVARIASVVVLAMSGLLAWQADSIFELFMIFYALLGGVGPIYVLRWIWWRVRAVTEITAMIASVTTTLVVTYGDITWNLGPLSSGGEITTEGRLLVVVGVSMTCAVVSMLVTRAPDPAALVPFYRRVRPLGFWGPVARLSPDTRPPRELGPALIGSLGGIATTYGLMLGLGFLFLERWSALTVSALLAVGGTMALVWALRRITPAPAGTPDEAR